MKQMIPAYVDGTLTPVEKMQVHRQGLRHLAVSVFVMSGEWLLLQKRAAEKYHTPGLWTNTCCTHPDWGEDPGDCAIRRLTEELGITGLTPRHVAALEYRADVGDGLIEHECVEVFLATAPRDLLVTPNPAEVSDTRWTRLDDLTRDVARAPERFTPWLRIYLRDHHGRIFGAS